MPARSGGEVTDSECGVVTIHGAGLDTWIWGDVATSLEVPHLAASFPGRDEHDEQTALGLPEYGDHVRQQIEAWSVERVVIVAHSIGGVVGLEVASRLPNRLAGFVGISAAIPGPGESFLSCYPLHQRIVRRAVMRLAGTKPPDSVVHRSLCGDLSDHQAARVVDEFVPESRSLYTDASAADAPDVRTGYVKTANDAEFSPALQDAMVENLGADKVTLVDAGHLPMLSEPRAIAAILNDFVAN